MELEARVRVLETTEEEVSAMARHYVGKLQWCLEITSAPHSVTLENACCLSFQEWNDLLTSDDVVKSLYRQGVQSTTIDVKNGTLALRTEILGESISSVVFAVEAARPVLLAAILDAQRLGCFFKRSRVRKRTREAPP